eukprot:SAG22_NODE_44_length_24912_cov_33.648894_3_plen_537_part_00
MRALPVAPAGDRGGRAAAAAALAAEPAAGGGTAAPAPAPAPAANEYAALAYMLSAAFVAIFTGQQGSWGIYSDTVKSNFDLTQSQLDTVASANAYVNIALLSIVPGIVYDRLSSRCGDRVAASAVLITTAVLVSSGTLLFWATVVGLIPVGVPASLGGATAQLTLLAAISAWGGEFTTAAIIPIVLKNFPHHRGVAVASAKCLNGVGGALVAQFYLGFLAPDTTSAILVGTCTSALAIFALPFMTVGADAEDPPDKALTNRRFARILGMELLLCLVALAASLANNLDRSVSAVEQKQLARGAAMAVLGTMVLVFASPVLYRCRLGLGSESASSRLADARKHLLSSPADPAAAAVRFNPSSSSSSTMSSRGNVGGGGGGGGGAAAAVDVPLKSAVLTVNFWLYIFCLFVCFGGGNYVSANIAQMVQALHLPAASVPFIITIMSLASGLSRVLVGATAHMLEDAGIPRTVFVLCSTSCMLGSQLLLTTSTEAGLYVGAALGQFGYGACYAYHPTIISDLYGIAHVSTLYKVASWTDAW